ncbi:hypothetical protein [Bacteroides rodentium]|nr:hypothetical protein [Bacteroides rodentium]
MEEEKGIKDNVEEVKENLQAGPGLTAGAEPRRKVVWCCVRRIW